MNNQGGSEMKKLFLAVMLIVLLSSNSFAQGGAMNSSGNPAGAQKENIRGQKGVATGKKVVSEERKMMSQMRRLIWRIEDRLPYSTPQQRIKLAEVMKDLSAQLLNMSDMMSKGVETKEQMKSIRDELAKMHKIMTDMYGPALPPPSPKDGL
jgi:hypothetical protein